MNKVVLIGRLTKDPELKFTPGNGTAVATFSIAVDRRFKSEGQPTADFIPIVVWGKQAENTANYMSKGKLIGISGRIQTRSYDAKDGTKRYVTEIVAEEVQFLGGRQSSEDNNDFGGGFGESSNASASFKKEPDYGNDVTPVDDDDIPF